jgi:hypothetical protein
MSTVLERRTATSRQQEPVADVDVRRERGTALRVLGAAAVLVVGAVHLEQYFGVHFQVVPVIGPLFLLNFIGSVVIAAGLLLPLHRLHGLLALGGIAVGVVSFVFLELSEHGGIFGFQDYGYRAAIVVALAAEAVAAVLLAGYLLLRR